MLHLADLLGSIPLPPLPEDRSPPGGHATLRADLESCCGEDATLVHDLGADLPAGHLHVWGGPSGAGKTAFLLCLLQSAAARGRRVVYATYELAPERLALRLLARTAGVEIAALPDPGSRGKPGAAPCTLDEETLVRVHAARERLGALPFDILPARGFSARSIHDRIVRMPFRAEVLAVDYLQAVVREPDEPVGASLRELSNLADHLHVAVICAVRAADTAGGGLEHPELDEIVQSRGVDRVGWLAPGAASDGARDSDGADDGTPEGATEGAKPVAGTHQAQVLSNRHGGAPTVPLHLDDATGSFERA